jgi:rifampin ADP-ribosylating transferase
MDGAVLAAELAEGNGKGRVYIVEPTGAIDDDPILTDQKFPGNITRSYRTREPLRIVDEVLDWQPHSPELLQDMKDGVEELTRLGIEAIND